MEGRFRVVDVVSIGFYRRVVRVLLLYFCFHNVTIIIITILISIIVCIVCTYYYCCHFHVQDAEMAASTCSWQL